MLYYFKAFKNFDLPRYEVKSKIYNNLKVIENVETYAKYFEAKLKKTKKNIDLKCNLKDLISDLNYLKQYLEKEATTKSCFFITQNKEE